MKFVLTSCDSTAHNIMKCLARLFLLAVAAIQAGQCGEIGLHQNISMIERTFDETQDSRIINGVDAQLFSRPYQASLQVYIASRGAWYHICGAAIIDVDRLVCAAHCLTPFPASWLRVEVGVLNLRAPPLEYTQFIDVLGVEWHEDYAHDPSRAFPNDIGVIYLKRPIVYNANVQPAKVSPGGQTFDDQECVISGWGSSYFGGPSEAKLQEANMTKWTYEKCLELHLAEGAYIPPTHLCVKGKPNEQGLSPGGCKGDSGGPLLCGEKRQYLAGVASYVFDGCSVDYPTVYTKVASYKSWISDRKHPKDNP
ncbi:Transmembrane protease serine 3 [Bulinus truncatus]|nr:Transmembrane protease serine 3 [Bulinus truncatus]